jgi:hypothetical protein
MNMNLQPLRLDWFGASEVRAWLAMVITWVIAKLIPDLQTAAPFMITFMVVLAIESLIANLVAKNRTKAKVSKTP